MRRLQFLRAVSLVVGLLLLFSAAIARDKKAPSEEQTIAEVVLDGLRQADQRAALKELDIETESLLDRVLLDKALRQLQAAHPQWAIGVADITPSVEGGMNVRIPVAYRHPQVELKVNADGTLNACVGADQLLKNSLPGVYSLQWLVNGKPESPEYNWMLQHSESYQAATGTLQLSYQWGTLNLTLHPEQDRLAMGVDVVNTSENPFTHLKLWLTSGVLFPSTPKGYGWTEEWAVITHADEQPSAVVADYGRGTAALCLFDATKHVNAGFGGRQHQVCLTIDDLPAHATQHATLSLRFGPGGDATDDPYAIAADRYHDFAALHPWQGPDWPDRRPIEAVFLTSSEMGAGTVGVTGNPRGWTFGHEDKTFETETPAGRAHFKELLWAYAKNAIDQCKEMNAQGMIVWAIEGEQYPQVISYIGTPYMLPELAPEMDVLADAWFKLFTDAGLRTGVCVRSQQLTQHPNYDPKAPPNQRPLKYYEHDLRDKDGNTDIPAVIEMLDKKISYAHKRWGCTLFYVDSNTICDGKTDPATGKFICTRWELYPAAIFAELGRRHPDCLIAPEESYFLYHASTAALGATSRVAHAVWPKAFSINLLQKPNWWANANDVAAVESYVRRGDVLFFEAGWRSPANAAVKAIYQRVKRER